MMKDFGITPDRLDNMTMQQINDILMVESIYNETGTVDDAKARFMNRRN